MNTYIFRCTLTNSLNIELKARNPGDAWNKLSEKVREAEQIGIRLPMPHAYAIVYSTE